MDRHSGDQVAYRCAAGFWLAAAILFVGSELAAAAAFSPPYSYARNYISDLGVTSCGTVFEGRPVCSPLQGLMNADFIAQGLLFSGAAIVISRRISAATTPAFLALAVMNGIGNVLIGCFPENAPGRLTSALSWHIVGALLAIVNGNGAALVSAATFATLRLPRLHRRASIGLPLAAAASLAMLIAARRAGTANMLPDAIWERISVYAITAWEVLTAACLMTRTRRRQAPS